MKLMKTEEAVGHVLCHDITQIIKDEKKGPVFRKGHIIRPEDVPVLLSVGKDHIYIWENDETMLHEDEAAAILRDLCMSENMHATEPKEGKIELVADIDGLLLIDIERLRAVNALGDMMIATRASGFVVKKGDKLCGTRVIPLVIEKARMEKAKEVAGPEPLMRLVPLKAKKVGVVTTGNEVFYGRIEDTFTPVIVDKLREFGGSEMVEHVVLNDDHEKITAAIRDMLDKGCEMVLCSGGMSVDPDDKTPLAIKNTGANIVSYGSPGGDVPRLLHAGRAPGLRPARLCHVRKAHDLRSAAALSHDRYPHHARNARGPWPRRPLPQLQGLPLPELRIWEGCVITHGSLSEGAVVQRLRES